jgi:hypothetical protein
MHAVNRNLLSTSSASSKLDQIQKVIWLCRVATGKGFTAVTQKYPHTDKSNQQVIFLQYVQLLSAFTTCDSTFNQVSTDVASLPRAEQVMRTSGQQQGH